MSNLFFFYLYIRRNYLSHLKMHLDIFNLRNIPYVTYEFNNFFLILLHKKASSGSKFNLNPHAEM